MNLTIPLENFTCEIVSPEKYLNFSPMDKANVDSVRIIPPTLGEDSFGKIQVNYRVPVFKVVNE